MFFFFVYKLNKLLSKLAGKLPNSFWLVALKNSTIHLCQNYWYSVIASTISLNLIWGASIYSQTVKHETPLSIYIYGNVNKPRKFRINISSLLCNFLFLRGALNKNAYLNSRNFFSLPFVRWHNHELFLRDEHLSLQGLSFSGTVSDFDQSLYCLVLTWNPSRQNPVEFYSTSRKKQN